ncbi:KdsC family phosphatase [Hydrogenimonas cancrithermarum]|uniref:3-deoxy-D-manno-octulosonate 8-phosphate phosphatase KdsC n=1 Tax=Hydrogenimonas cancrithermarum TaxID=2993563 RepID=A0ABN6WX96_9BACT|nr:HAD-IIIA family hydrolase [Hydrogenimonas cancrithermarum]BDY13915.1 3-deoxy-D-manno-octulosonate 8-phosphate phosphatase [Hydrogenimonas cancrithermarum]
MIRLLVLDVDGCLTDGKIIYTDEGDEIKAFNVKDGFAIVNWMALGRHAAIITGRRSKIVERRAKELGIVHFYQGVKDKLAMLQELCDELGMTLDEVAVIGDDLNDYRMLEACGRSFVPADAMHHVTAIADVVLSQKGGDGAVREMIDLLIRQEGLEEEYLSRWT